MLPPQSPRFLGLLCEPHGQFGGLIPPPAAEAAGGRQDLRGRCKIGGGHSGNPGLNETETGAPLGGVEAVVAGDTSGTRRALAMPRADPVRAAPGAFRGGRDQYPTESGGVSVGVQCPPEHFPIRARNRSARNGNTYLPAMRPAFLCRPDRVSGTPMVRDIFPFVADTPVSRLHDREIPYLFRLTMSLLSLARS